MNVLSLWWESLYMERQSSYWHGPLDISSHGFNNVLMKHSGWFMENMHRRGFAMQR